MGPDAVTETTILHNELLDFLSISDFAGGVSTAECSSVEPVSSHIKVLIITTANQQRPVELHPSTIIVNIITAAKHTAAFELHHTAIAAMIEALSELLTVM